MDPTYLGQPIQVPTKTPAQRRGPSGRLLMIFAGLLVAILAGIGLIVANQDTSGPLSQRLTYRLEALQDILKDGKKNASSDKLRKITSETALLLTGDITAVKAAAPAAKGKKPAEVVAAESSDSAIERLKTAKVNGTYDSTYTTELSQKLESTNALLKELYDETRSKKLKETLDTTYQHLAQTEKELATN